MNSVMYLSQASALSWSGADNSLHLVDLFTDLGLIFLLYIADKYHFPL